MIADKRTLMGMSLISLGGMVVEIALTRVYSLVLFYHFVFLVIGLSMLGLAAGGVLAWRLASSSRWGPGAASRWAAICSAATAMSTVLIVVVAPAGELITLSLLASLAFVLIGSTTAVLLAQYPHSTGRVYAADLVGAALGALVSVPLINLVGGINALLVAAAAMGWASVVLAYSRSSAVPSLTVALLVTLAAMLNPATSILDINVTAIQQGKGLVEQLREGGYLLFTRWDALARTDVVARDDHPDQLYLYIDGGSAAVMYDFSGDPVAPSPLRSDFGFFPFHDRPAGTTLSIGPGGGKDVLLALMGGASRVTAVEVNPGAVEAVRRFSDFNGGIYDRPDVEVVVDEGRGYLKRSTEQFDTIYMSLAVTQTAERVGFAMAENYLYTVEAMRDYLDHLKPGGRLVLRLHNQYDLIRAMLTVDQAALPAGAPDSERGRNMMALVQPADHDEHQGDIMYPLLIVQKEPFTPDQEQHHLAAARAAGYQDIYTPSLGVTGQLVDAALLAGISEIKLDPVTDDRPFFYLYEAGPPPFSVLLMIVAALAGGLGWIVVRRRTGGERRMVSGSLAFFGCLGVAFMLVEVAMIQKLTLLLGHPTVAVTTVLFVLLISGGIGSWLSSVVKGGLGLAVVAGALAAGLILVYTQLLPILVSQSIVAPWPQRVVVSVAVLAPLGVLMGVPFPTGLKALGLLTQRPLTGLAWAANGIASVLGSTGAIVLGTSLGFSASLSAGALVYLASGVVAYYLMRHPLGAEAVSTETPVPKVSEGRPCQVNPVLDPTAASEG